MIAILLGCNFSYAQKSDIDYKVDIDTTFQVFDYFNQRIDSLFCEYERVLIMDCSDYIFNDKQAVYVTKKELNSSGNGSMKIYVDNELLFYYNIENNKINGIGYLYNPVTKTLLYQGEFKDNLLDGMVFCFGDNKPGIIHSMLFKKGKPVKILYVWNLVQTEKNYKKVNKRKYFKNGKSISVISYPF